MKKIILLALVATTITGCAPRMSEREAEETRAAYRGAAMQQAMANAAALYPPEKNSVADAVNGDQHHHHKHHKHD